MNQEILTLIEGADPFTKKVMLQGFMRNCEFWGRKALAKAHEIDEKLTMINQNESVPSDAYVEYLADQRDEQLEKVQLFRQMYKAAKQAL